MLRKSEKPASTSYGLEVSLNPREDFNAPESIRNVDSLVESG